MKPRRKTRERAISLVELLCVVAIIAVLLALYLPAMARAFGNVKDFLFGE
jgi:prepilin-type N-terminal cleavage/methylation domain-containing protein